MIKLHMGKCYTAVDHKQYFKLHLNTESSAFPLFTCFKCDILNPELIQIFHKDDKDAE